MSERRRVLTVSDLALFTVSGIIVLEQLAASAAIGPSALGWWMVTLVLFCVPYAAITAELGAAWPSQGGFYVWIREAFGWRWAARAIWYYWIQLAIWIPSVAILAASMSSQLFWPNLSMVEKLGIAILFILSIAAIGSLRTDVGKWVPNIGALLKVVLMLCIGAGGAYLAARGAAQTELTVRSIAPSYEGAINYLPIIVFNLMGFELMASAGGEIKDPQRNIPKAIVASVVLIGTLYVFATYGMLVALSPQEIVLDTGIIEALRAVFATSVAGSGIVTVLGIAVIVTLLTNMVTWSMAANRSVQTAAADGVMPQVFGIEHPALKTPVAANAVMAILSSTVVVLYFFMAASLEELFWTLLAFSSVIFFLPYFLIFSAFLKLRAAAPARPRPYRAPGGWPGAVVAAGLCMLFVGQALVLFVYVPGRPPDWSYLLSILGGVVIVLAAGERVIRAPAASAPPVAGTGGAR